jgi:hypothetical protein
MSIFIAFFKRLFLRGQPFVFMLVWLPLFFGRCAHAQVSFERHYRFGEEDYGMAIREAADGSFIMAGYTSWPDSLEMALLVCKITSNGEVVWRLAPQPGRENFGTDLLPGPLPETWALVGTCSDSTGKKQGLWLLFNEQGEVLQSRIYGADQPLTLRQGIRTSDGYILSGQVYHATNSNQFFLMKIGNNGEEIWRKSFGGIGNEYFKALILWPQGNGLLGVGDIQDGNQPTDVVVVRMNQNGDSLGSNRYGNAYANGSQSILAMPDGGFMVLGESAVAQNGPFQFYLLRLNAQADSLAGFELGGPGSDAAFSGTVLSNGDLVVCGYSSAQPQQPISASLMRVTPQGQITWLRRFQPDTLSIAYQLTACQDGGFALAATCYGPPNTALVVRTGDEGLLNLTQPEPAASITPFPNPAATGQQVRVLGDWLNRELDLVDVQGRVCSTFTVTPNSGHSFCAPKPGCYLIRSRSVGGGKMLVVTP